MKKIFTAVILSLFVFSLISSFAFASDVDAGQDGEGNVFDSIYSELLEHSDKILAALAFLGSVLLMVSYKKGVLPILKGGLSSLSSSVTSLKEEAKRSGELSESEIKEATEMLSRAEEILTALSKRLETINSELEDAMQEQKKNSDIKLIMEYQIDMLYEIFMSSSLPVYQKEAVGEKISLMKERLSRNAEESVNE